MRSQISDNVPLHLGRKESGPSEPEIVRFSQNSTSENTFQLSDAIVNPVNVSDTKFCDATFILNKAVVKLSGGVHLK